MSFVSTNRSSWRGGAIASRPTSARRSGTSAHAEPPLWAHASNSVITVPTRDVVFQSCRNRACPKCQSGARDQWLARTARELLPAPYSHVTFTLPHQLCGLALQNPRLIYGILFQAASETLLTLGADSRRLGAQLGFLAVLHTWDQQMRPHPHLHCLVPAGGIAPDRSRWVRTRRPRYLLPASVLAADVPQSVPDVALPRLSPEQTQTRRRTRSAEEDRRVRPAPSRSSSDWSGWSMPSLPSADPSMSSSTWPATRIAWPSPTGA